MSAFSPDIADVLVEAMHIEHNNAFSVLPVQFNLNLRLSISKINSVLYSDPTFILQAYAYAGSTFDIHLQTHHTEIIVSPRGACLE